MTVTFDAQVHEGLHQKIGKRNISYFLESLARPYVVNLDQADAYKQMAQDETREEKAVEWSEGLMHDFR